jgi:hypothetical protein
MSSAAVRLDVFEAADVRADLALEFAFYFEFSIASRRAASSFAERSFGRAPEINAERRSAWILRESGRHHK